MIFRLTVSYRGEAYAGWQRQPNALGVQQVVEEALEQLVSAPVKVTGAGRTDAGVHAAGQVVHLALDERWAPEALVGGTNHRLPDDIRVLDAAPASAEFHARKSAIAKEYRYHLSRAPVISPLEAPFCAAAPRDLDLDLLSRGARALEGRHDFTAFAKAGGSHTSPYRQIFLARFDAVGDRLTFRVIGDGFLRGMVRALVGSLIDLGRGRVPLSAFEALLEGRPRSAAGAAAKARGLVLQKVFYEGDRW